MIEKLDGWEGAEKVFFEKSTENKKNKIVN